MEPSESFDSSSPLSADPNAALDSLSWEAVCSWNEEDEIRFVEEEDDQPSCRPYCPKFHLSTRQEWKARHIPGLAYIPALVATW